VLTKIIDIDSALMEIYGGITAESLLDFNKEV
jgi:hypothetical protein